MATPDIARKIIALGVTGLVLQLSALAVDAADSRGSKLGKPEPGECIETILPGGARGLYCVPLKGWNGDVIVFAHGYTAVTEPLDYQNLTFGGIDLPELVQELGFAFATTTYRQTGLTIVEGVEDVRQLALAFRAVTGKRAQRFIIAGASEGGIVTVLVLEKYPSLFAGGLAMCGPIGNFRFQTDYVANFRILFDYYFPGVLPGNAIDVPAGMLSDWSAVHIPDIRDAILSDPDRARMLLDVARAAYEPQAWETVENTIIQLLWYHTFGTEDAQNKLGGNPFDNRYKRYRGSSDDSSLNSGVSRYAADRQALRSIQRYNTTGKVNRPLVVLHTTGDEVIPFAHNLAYLAKVRQAGGGMVRIYPIERYGHCNFNVDEVLGAVLVLLSQMR